MTITVNVKGHGSLNFPDGTDPAVVQKTVQQIVAGEHPSQTQAPEQPAAPAPAYEAAAMNTAQGATMGWGDEIGHGIASALGPVGYGIGRGVNAAENVFGTGNPNPPDYDTYAKTLENNKNTVMSPLAAYNAEHPIIGGAEQAAGGVASMMGLSKLAGASIPKVANALKAFAEAHPYLAAAGAGGSGGAVYGAGTGDETAQGRGGNALVQGSIGAVTGPLATLAANKLVAPAYQGGKRALGALQDYIAGTGSEVAPAVEAAAAPAATAPISDITNEPLNTTVVPNAAGPASATGNLPLSPGVRAKDSNLLRVEENARQGLLGNEAQGQIQANDSAVVQDARRAMQQLKGATNQTSDELFTGAVSKFQDAAKQTKDAAQALYKQRDEMLANTVVNRRMVGPSLGADLNDAVNAPTTISAFKSKAGAPAMALYQDFKDIVKGGANELPMVNLTAWRQDVAALATKEQGTPAGVAASSLGRAYDQWMDNSFKQRMVLQGDAGVADIASKASSAWKSYKSLFGSENSSVIAGMTKPYDATPRDFVDKVFGANIAGNGNTALNVRKMVAALPEEAQQQFKENIFSGLVSKVFEGADNADTLKMAALRNNLQKLQGSQVYQEFFAGDKAKDTVITNLVNDLTQHITQSGRRDVISPSGGAIARNLKSLVSGMAQIPIVGKATGAKVADTALNKVGDMAQASTDRAVFRQAMRDFAKDAREAATKGKVFDFGSLHPSMVGVTVGGVNANNANRKEKVQ